MLYSKVIALMSVIANARDTGIIAIENLMQKKGKFDYILLETTGLAGAFFPPFRLSLYQSDPGPIASMFWLDDSLGSSIYLDGIVTVVDAVNIHRSLDDHDNVGHNLSTAHLQISHSDAILLNKIDLVDKSARISVSDRIKSINAIAKLYETEYSRIPSLDDILDLHAYDDADFPINNFNRDTSGHLDHVFPSLKCN